MFDRMFDKVLIANRGEIAVRVLRTCQAMGIGAVVVYSDPDRDALAVRLAAEAKCQTVALGGRTAAESYLDIGKIIDAAKQAGADAVHPGYGFLSENAEFAEACAAAGLVFIGPPSGIIAEMGDKLAAKRRAVDAGVSVIPGGGEVATDEAVIASAREIGFPVMLKAAAGGGGKGMRVVSNGDELIDSYRSATREATAAFGDGRIFVEKFIENPRHIEIQILADAHGNIVHLGERECSIQRRHQKVIEESPSPLLDEKTRAAMGAQAVALAQAVGYQSAGTVEFVSDQERNFYFLEMNTRLQVEHPVTEYVTGLDLVEWMIRIAAGEKLDFGQDDVSMKGWAMEARIYAEDPVRGFLPSTGRLVRYREPDIDGGTVRVDSGVGEGDEIGIQYDPMMAKLIVHQPTRAAAAMQLSAALDQYIVHGLNHNIGFLGAVVGHRRFLAGDLSTDFIDAEWPDGYLASEPEGEDFQHLASIAVLIEMREGRREDRGSWAITLKGDDRPDGEAGECGDQKIVDVVPIDGGYRLTGLKQAGDIDIISAWRPGEPRLDATLDGCDITVSVERIGLGNRLRRGGFDLTFLVVPARLAPLLARMPEKVAADTGKFVVAPMPGLLVSLEVEEGQTVKLGEALAIIEAMKMENILRAEREGVVAALHAGVGDSLQVDQKIIEFE